MTAWALVVGGDVLVIGLELCRWCRINECSQVLKLLWIESQGCDVELFGPERFQLFGQRSFIPGSQFSRPIEGDRQCLRLLIVHIDLDNVAFSPAEFDHDAQPSIAPDYLACSLLDNEGLNLGELLETGFDRSQVFLIMNSDVLRILGQ